MEAASPRLRLVRRIDRRQGGTPNRTARDEENDRLRSEVLSLRRQLNDMQFNYESELQRLLGHIAELKSRCVVADPVASAVRQSVSSFTSLHHTLQLELSDFHSKTLQRLRGRESDVYNLCSARVKQLEHELAAERENGGRKLEDKGDLWKRVKELQEKVTESEQFNTQLLADNRELREKCREYKTFEEVHSKEHLQIMQENAKLKRKIDDFQTPPLPNTRDASTQDSPDSSDPTNALICVVDALKSKIATCQKELRTVTQELLKERTRKTDLEVVLERCVEEVRTQSRALESYSGRLHGTLTPRQRQDLLRQLLLEEKCLQVLQLHAFPVGTLRSYLNDASPFQPSPEGCFASNTYRSKSVIRLPR